MALTKVKAGNIILTTPAASSNDVTPATTQYVTTALANLADSAPATLNTLNELAAALGDDANFSTTVTNSIATKLPLAGGTLTGTLAMGSNAITSTGTISSGAITSTGNLLLDVDNAEINLKSGVGGTSGAINWTYNSTGTDYASIKLPYDTRASTGLHIDSGYPITIDSSSGTGIKFDVTGANRATITGTGLAVAGTITGTSFSDGYISWGAAQLNRYGSNIELQYTPTANSTVYIGANGSNPTRFNAYTGVASFSGAVLVGSTTNLNVLSGDPMLQIGAGTGHSSLQFYSATGSVGALYFGDAASGVDRYDGYLEYRHNSRDMAFRAGGATVLTLKGNNANGTGHNVDYGEHQHDVGEGVGVGEFYTQVAGSSFTDQFRINFDNPSWGGVTVDIRLNPNSSAGASVWVQYTIYSHSAHASANISAKDISGEGTGYINWVQESAGNLKCQLKTQYVTDDASARITYQMNHRGSQSIYLEEI